MEIKIDDRFLYRTADAEMTRILRAVKVYPDGMIKLDDVGASGKFFFFASEEKLSGWIADGTIRRLKGKTSSN